MVAIGDERLGGLGPGAARTPWRWVAMEEARGAAGAGGRETGPQEMRSSGAGVGLPPREGARASVLGQRGAQVTGCPAQRPPPRTAARQRPGATKCRGSSGWQKELAGEPGSFRRLHCVCGVILNNGEIKDRSLFWEMHDGLFKDKMSPWFIKNINR